MLPTNGQIAEVFSVLNFFPTFGQYFAIQIGKQLSQKL